jgi:hypothetical protein
MRCLLEEEEEEEEGGEEGGGGCSILQLRRMGGWGCVYRLYVNVGGFWRRRRWGRGGWRQSSGSGACTSRNVLRSMTNRETAAAAAAAAAAVASAIVHKPMDSCCAHARRRLLVCVGSACVWVVVCDD